MDSRGAASRLRGNDGGNEAINLTDKPARMHQKPNVAKIWAQRSACAGMTEVLTDR